MSKTNNILLTVGNLSTTGGVSFFWTSLLDAFQKNSDISFEVLEIGGHGKNIFGPFVDQYKVYKKSQLPFNLAIINPSLLSRSFLRDGLFAKQLYAKKIPFIVFFHGWDLDFEKKVSTSYVNFFLNSFGKAQSIFTLSSDFKKKMIEWGYKGEIIVETTVIDASLTSTFSIESRKNILYKKDFKILFLARLEKEKGIFELLDAMKNINITFPQVELIIAGEGDAYEKVKQQVKEQKNIKMVGYVQGEEKIALFKKCDIYCLPSYSEGLPISVLEALAFGLPVITTKVGGLKDFFQDNTMGYFVNVEESLSIEDKLARLLSNPQKMLQMGEFNFSYAKQHLYNDVVSQRLYPFFQEKKND
jgi:glycosyltransferase involved in cell wall biosynthesis